MIKTNRRDTVTVFGSHGSVEFDARTGKRLGLSTAYPDVIKIDLDEWCKTYPEEDPTDRDIDILDLRLHRLCDESRVEIVEPVKEWRDEVRATSMRMKVMT